MSARHVRRLEGVQPEQVAGGDAQQLEALGPGQGGGVGAVDDHGPIEVVEDVEGAGIGGTEPRRAHCWRRATATKARARSLGACPSRQPVGRCSGRSSTSAVQGDALTARRTARPGASASGTAAGRSSVTGSVSPDDWARPQHARPGSSAGLRAAGRIRAWLTCAWRCARSTRSSATSTETSSGSSRPWPGPRSDGADLVAFPELTVTGYPPEDLLLKPAFVSDNLAGAATGGRGHRRVAWPWSGFVDVVGHDSVPDAVARAVGAGVVAREAAIRGAPRRLRNAVAVCAGGDVLGVYHKRRLPNYGVFDEERWFAPGTSELELFEVAGVPWACRCARTCGSRPGPSPPRRRAGPAWSST